MIDLAGKLRFYNSSVLVGFLCHSLEVLGPTRPVVP